MLTQQQWYDKLKKFVPSWWFEKIQYSQALYQAVAATFLQLEQDSDDQFNATFITEATTPVLDAIGDERSIDRNTSETDALYRPRVQRITSATDKASLKALVDSFLLTGECTIYEAPLDAPYYARGFYCGREAYLLEARRNFFLVVIPQQVHASYSFYARSVYAARSNFFGSTDSSATIFASIIAALDRAKAFGVMYAILEIS
jgi:hypothetical protein